MYQVRSEVFICIVSFDFDSNLVKYEGLLHEVQVAQVVVENGKVYIKLDVIVHYGCSVGEVAKNVQQRVKSTVENMTGLKVSTVDVKIAEVNIENYK